ncbi:MAG TPA: hypothetical protein VGZ32_03710 [Actinocrinis sp.]|uniref:hypothetical protein n=1 Tax=Actinocrinis sp. TaxID=1920516 RepID=UPI002DDD287B|nr:hypothetical protein [Actinocrinis sp.]HEV3169414.1 hypothetical protein [Actinocrinis sp.]
MAERLRISEKDFLAVQRMRATHTAPAHTCLLAGMLACAPARAPDEERTVPRNPG